MSSAQVALRDAVRRLQAAGVQTAARDARRLLAHVLDVDPGRLVLHLPEALPQGARDAFNAMVGARARRVPVSHLIGKRAFYGRDFIVSADVLDPRPETEILVEQALRGGFSTALDLGTGSGAILLSLLAERDDAYGTGTDLSVNALTIAQQNAKLLGVFERCTFTQSNWFDSLDRRFDLIVSNPPYIALDEMSGLDPELAYEPRMALTDEADGLTAYRAITRAAPRHLSGGGRLIVEIGPTQADPVRAMFESAGFEGIGTANDLDGRARVVLGHLKA